MNDQDTTLEMINQEANQVENDTSTASILPPRESFISLIFDYL